MTPFQETCYLAAVTKTEHFAVSKITSIVYNLDIIQQMLSHLGQKCHHRTSQKYPR
jgi:hypothetical protein